MEHAEFARKVLADTGENIHWIELTVAMNWYWTHKADAAEAWTAAKEFMRAMKERYDAD